MISKFFGSYPRGFWGLSTTKMCFNFSFYGFRAFFVLYAISQFSLSEYEAVSFFATVMTLSYATSLLGGWVADNSLGLKNTILLGGFLQASGYCLLMASSLAYYAAALAFITLGSGFCKPTLPAALGLLFTNPQDPEKDKAYSTFYIAMNLGSFIAPLLCGVLNTICGAYWGGFSALILSLVMGISVFYRTFNGRSRRPLKTFFCHPLFVGGGLTFLLTLFYLLFTYHNSFHHLMGGITLGSLLYVGHLLRQSSPDVRKNIVCIMGYVALFTIFCAFFEQAGSSLMLFFDKAVDRQVMGFQLPSSTLLSLSPIFILLWGPMFILFSKKVLERKAPIRGLVKIGGGFLCIGLSFIILALGCTQATVLVSPLWVVGAIFIQTMGELWVVPIVFSRISQLSPPHFEGLMMSFTMMAIAYGHYVGGYLAQFSLHEAGTSLHHYEMFFNHLALIPCLVSLVLFLSLYAKKS